jgi:hypothetical protein
VCIALARHLFIQAERVLKLVSSRVSGYLGLVKETAFLLALALVKGLLRDALGRVALEFGCALVGQIGDVLLRLVESRLARVGSDGLLGLGGEILASRVRHFQVCSSVCLFV